MAGRTFASLALLARVLASPYRCQTNPDDDLVLRGRDNATHVIPGLPRNPSDYDYAVERAFVVLPPVCVSELGLEADAAGARSTGRRFWVGRVGDAAWTWRLADCACGWVVFLQAANADPGRPERQTQKHHHPFDRVLHHWWRFGGDRRADGWHIQGNSLHGRAAVKELMR